MKATTACITGHRIIESKDLAQLTQLLNETIEKLIGQGVIFWGTGAAIGFDTLAAQAILKQREKNSTVKLITVLPCRDQDTRWRETDRQIYRQLLDSADKVVCLSERYFDGCMAQRNLHLIEHSSICVAYMKRAHSGASQTVRFAREHGLKIINLAEHL